MRLRDFLSIKFGIINLVVIATIFLTPAYAEAKTYPPNTNNVIQQSFDIGKAILNRPYLFQSIAYTESTFGQRKSNSSSMGVMQIQVCAAQTVFQLYPNIRRQYLHNYSINNVPIILKILETPKDNMVIGAYLFKWLLLQSHGNVDQAISWYNTGRYTGYYNVEYVSKVRYNISRVKHIDYMENIHAITPRTSKSKSVNR